MTSGEPLPLSALEHYRYCPRQCALIHADGVWQDSTFTVRGQAGHRRVDNAPSGTARGVLVLRGLELWSERLDLVGRADAVEVHPDGTIVPVEYKIGRRHGDAADIQVCAQALCLEEMTGSRIDHGYLWLSAHRRRHRVDFDEDLRRRTLDAIGAVRDLLAAERLPGAVDDERCPACQLLGYCLPGLVSRPEQVRDYLDREVLACE